MLPSVSSHMNVPAPPLNGLTGTADQVPGVPGTAGGGLVGPVPVGGGPAVVGAGPPVVGAGRVVAGPVVAEPVVGAAVVRVAGAADVATAPVHAQPFRLKLDGTGLADPFQDPLNPKLTPPLVGMAAL